MLADAGLSAFIREHLTPEQDRDLCRIREQCVQEGIPVLQEETAAFLKVLTGIKQPQTILEIGAAAGFSGCLMLKNCAGQLKTIERDGALCEKAAGNFFACGFALRAQVWEGDADEILPNVYGSFDMIFMDAAKSRYAAYYEYLIDLLPFGGVLVCDNVLFGGRIADTSKRIRKSAAITNGLDAFLKRICGDVRVQTSLLPLGDGITVSVKQ